MKERILRWLSMAGGVIYALILCAILIGMPAALFVALGQQKLDAMRRDRPDPEPSFTIREAEATDAWKFDYGTPTPIPTVSISDGVTSGTFADISFTHEPEVWHYNFGAQPGYIEALREALGIATPTHTPSPTPTHKVHDMGYFGSPGTALDLRLRLEPDGAWSVILDSGENAE